MYYQEIESVFRRNLETRYMSDIHLPEMFPATVKSLMDARHVVILTGFVVKAAKAGETDGPPGALSLACCFKKLAVQVTLVTDAINESIVRVGLEALALDVPLVVASDVTMEALAEELFVTASASHLIAIERPSRAADDECYSMRGEKITEYVANTDILVTRAKEFGVTTIGIGDGGNEVGMAVIKEYVHGHVPMGPKICATTEVDYLLIGGVSNWVAYGICGALSVEKGLFLLPEDEAEVVLIESMVKAGAVDGIEKRQVAKVDGIDMAGNLAILNAIRALVAIYMKKN